MADVRHRGRGRRTAYRRLAVAGAVERPAGLETHPGAFSGGLRPDAGALHRHRAVVRT